MHPYDAELQTRGYVENDRKMIRELADLYDPDIPAHENPAYVARTRELLASHEDAMRGGGAIFGGRHDRGWVPPSNEDVSTCSKEHSEQPG